MSVLHYVKDVEYVSLVLQSRTLFQLPHQCCKVCVALRVPRQVQISSTVGLVRDVRVNILKSQEKTRFVVEGSAAPAAPTVPWAASHEGHAEVEELQVG